MDFVERKHVCSLVVWREKAGIECRDKFCLLKQCALYLRTRTSPIYQWCIHFALMAQNKIASVRADFALIACLLLVGGVPDKTQPFISGTHFCIVKSIPVHAQSAAVAWLRMQSCSACSKIS